MLDMTFGNEDERAFAPFDTTLAARNNALVKMGLNPPKMIKTGTTIAGLVFKDGVIMAADSRATSGNVIADKYCVKLHKITDYIYACGAGTAADLDQMSNLISAQMKLHELNTGRNVYVINALRFAKQHLFRYMGHVGAYLLIGGVDFYGPHLFNVHAHGSSLGHSFVSDGSGSLAATSILEKEFKMNMEESDALDLLSRAVMAGMHNDLSSGNTFSFNIIKKDGCRVERRKIPDFCVAEPKLLKYEFPASKALNVKKVEYDVIEEMEYV